MLQIKNTLGGGKPEGLYVWKKYEIGTSYIEKTTQHEAQSNGIVITKGLTFNSNMTVKVTRATSYTFDSATGKYTLTNNISSFDVVSGVASGSTSYSTALNGYYFMLGDDTEADYMYKGCDSYSIGFTNNGDGTCKMWEQYVGNPIYAYSADTEPTYTFLDYIVSDKETAYPDGGEKGGYWYERVNSISGTDKIIFDAANQLIPDAVKALSLVHTEEITLTSDSDAILHSYVGTPNHFILTTEDFDWSNGYVLAVTNITHLIIGGVAMRKYILSGNKAVEGNASSFINITSTSIKNTQNGYKFIAGHTYKLYVFA